ncbi:MAG: hypothetical protein HOK67_11785 [Deltaproteobacteria bacterium]|nr:hypothetical protein [Deltaproteobacteria bacterium]
MITPFKENGDVDYDGHIENMQRWNEDLLTGYLVLGSNSETVYLNDEAQIHYFRQVADQVKIPILIYNVCLYPY